MKGNLDELMLPNEGKILQNSLHQRNIFRFFLTQLPEGYVVLMTASATFFIKVKILWVNYDQNNYMNINQYELSCSRYL